MLRVGDWGLSAIWKHENRTMIRIPKKNVSCKTKNLMSLSSGIQRFLNMNVLKNLKSFFRKRYFSGILSFPIFFSENFVTNLSLNDNMALTTRK